MQACLHQGLGRPRKCRQRPRWARAGRLSTLAGWFLGITILTSLAGSAARADPPRLPFGGVYAGFPIGTLRPSESQAALERETAAFYDQWKARYLIPGCGPGELRIKADAGENGSATTVSEGQGYGMVIVALMAGHEHEARAIFDRLYRYARRHPSDFDPMLMAWAQNQDCTDIEGRDSATDGDLDIAYALLLADAQWGSTGAIDYRAEAALTLKAIVRHTIDPRTGLTMLGDWVTGADPHARSTRPSDWMVDHFRAFAAVEPAIWRRAVDAHLDLAVRLQRDYAPQTGLLPDFVVDTHDAPKPARADFLEASTDGDFAWNACRTPWRIGTDALVSGDRRAIGAVRKMTAWIRDATEGDPSRIGESYRLDGEVLDSAPNMAFTAPFAVAAMSTPGAQPWLDALWSEIVARQPEGYYPDSIKLQVMLTVAGIWWSPAGGPLLGNVAGNQASEARR